MTRLAQEAALMVRVQNQWTLNQLKTLMMSPAWVPRTGGLSVLFVTMAKPLIVTLTTSY